MFKLGSLEQERPKQMKDSFDPTDSATIKLMAGHYNNYSGDAFMQHTSEPTTMSNFITSADIPYEVISFNEGEMLFKEGDQPQGLYVLKAGCVKMFVNREHSRGRTTSPEYVTKLLSPGEVFGYKSLIFNEPNLAFAKAITSATDFIWCPLLIVMISGRLATKMMGVKSFTESYGRLV